MALSINAHSPLQSHSSFLPIFFLFSYFQCQLFFVSRQTHAPHNENDEPIEEYITLLDPVRLLTLVPRNIGFTVAESYDSLNDKLVQATKNDNFIINFSQFYMILLRVTQIVYGDLFESDATLAFNKLLQVKNLLLFFFFRFILYVLCSTFQILQYNYRACR